MRRIAFLISSNMVAGAPGARDDVFELGLELDALAPACSARRMSLEPVIWNDPTAYWAAYAAAVVGPTWDYFDDSEAFLAAMNALAERGPLFNPARVLAWNLDKSYLADLERDGAAVIPTIWADAATEAAVADAFDAFETDRVVIKPRVGGGAWRLAQIRRGEALPPAERLPQAGCLIQPYLPSIESRGEISLLFYDGVFSHAVRKVPKSGDFRVQSLYGAREEAYQPQPDEIAAATTALEAVGERLLYARVDVVTGLDGEPAVIELELIEPYHYPEQGPMCGHHFAAALDRYLS